MPASAQVRARTAELHRRLERTPFARAAQEARVGRVEYLDYLRALSVIVSTVDTEVSRFGSSEQKRLFAALADWRVLLAQDIEALGVSGHRTNSACVRAALGLVGNVRRRVDCDPAYLLGVAYVLFGSHKGNRTLAAPVASALSLSGEAGTQYLGATARPGKDDWQVVLAAMDEHLVTEGDVDRATAGARDVFDAFDVMLNALIPGAPRSTHVTALNPEAGDHQVPTSAARLELAERIGVEAMARFPYLKFRFGERGIATLPAMAPGC